MRRVESPPGGSTLITSAPRSASCIAQNGPAITCVTSRTRIPSRAVGEWVMSGSVHVPPARHEEHQDHERPEEEHLTVGACAVRSLPYARRERTCVIADVLGPACGLLLEASTFACKQRPRGFLEPRQIARHRGHETIRCLLRLTHTILVGIRAPRMLNEPPQRDRPAA